MAEVPIIISGVMCDKYGRVMYPCTIMGQASIAGLGIGGGPIIPPEEPPRIWGPTDPRPGVGPIVPGMPGWDENRPPSNVIVVPKPPEAPPQQPDQPKPPTENNGWGWHPAYGWGYFPPNQAVPKTGGPQTPPQAPQASPSRPAR